MLSTFYRAKLQRSQRAFPAQIAIHCLSEAPTPLGPGPFGLPEGPEGPFAAGSAAHGRREAPNPFWPGFWAQIMLSTS